MWKLKIAEGNGDPWLESLNNHIGRQHWEFDSEAGTPEERAEVERARENYKKDRFKLRNSAEILMRMQLTKENPSLPIPPSWKLEEHDDITQDAVTTTFKRGVNFYSSIQSHDGHWPADIAGPLFFMPPLVIALYITGAMNVVLSAEHLKEMKRYIYNHQNEDGGWGIHIEGHSTMFGSALNYIALRLLGEGPDDGEDNAVARGRQWILDHGGVTGIISWGKFWLTVLGVYEWDGCNPMPPELWLLPDISPVHAGHLLCYCRLVYMPMSYLYGRRYVGPITQLIGSLRNELYTEPYADINWNKARNTFAKEDLYYPHPLVQDMLWGFLRYFTEPVMNYWPFSKLRQKALKVAMEHVHYEDINSRYFTIGCVEKAICMIACWVEDPNSIAFKKHLARIPDYLWVAEDGMKIQSFGSQTWDAVFSIQAILASGLTHEHGTTLKKAHEFLKVSQLRENPSGDFTKMYRHVSKGGWTFSVRDHGWPVSDCTAEGLKTALLLSKLPSELAGEKIDAECLYDAVNIILNLQSDNGGFTAWEPRLAYRWLEKFNPTEFLQDCFIETEYLECTSSAIQSLALFKMLFPEYRRKEIDKSMSRGLSYIEKAQRPDGSWYGHWGICFTYGSWFAVKALVTCGMNYENSMALRKACKFLLSKQLPDGGWGESYFSSSTKVYTNLEGNRSNLVQTAWALLSLMLAGQLNVDPIPIERGVRLLINSQMDDGDYPQQSITGVYYKNCTLTYALHRNIFPIWALGEYQRLRTCSNSTIN